MQGRQLGLPARRVGRDLDDAVVDDVGVDHAAAAAIVAAGAGDDRFARAIGAAGLLVDRVGHGPHGDRAGFHFIRDAGSWHSAAGVILSVAKDLMAVATGVRVQWS
jgi:hypothetical protein